MLDRLLRAARGSVLETRPHYRTAIGALGIALPPILILGWLIWAASVESSISAYYYTRMRDWFVGTLWVIGVFLFFYQYRPGDPSRARSKRESVRSGAADSWLGKAAGVCSVLVALIPTAPPPDSKYVPPTVGIAHGMAAGVLFLCLALFPLLLFSQARERGHVYRVYGWTMIGLLVFTVGYVFTPAHLKADMERWRPLLILETLLIVTFGFSWFARGRELAAREAEAPRAEDARAAQVA